VIEVLPRGPSDLAGLRPHDVIVAANDRIIAGVDDLHRVLSSRLAGQPQTSPAGQNPETAGLELTVIRDERAEKIHVSPRYSES
jgi:S1-C subfamily serine protease